MRVIAETQRLILRELAVEDAAFMVRLMNDEAWLKHIGDRGVRTVDQAEENLRLGAIDMYTRRGHGLWRVELKASGMPIGICGLIKRDTLEDIDLGFAFLPEFRGAGYALEASEACMHHARNNLDVRRVVAIVSPANLRSIALLEKLGFRWETTIPISADNAVEKHLFAHAG